MKSILRLVREKCLDCCGGQPKEVRLCEIEACPLHALRFGKNPRRKGIGKRRNLKTNSPDRAAEHSPSEIVEKTPTQWPISEKESFLEVGS
jgi:hypothetical protein